MSRPEDLYLRNNFFKRIVQNSLHTGQCTASNICAPKGISRREQINISENFGYSIWEVSTDVRPDMLMQIFLLVPALFLPRRQSPSQETRMSTKIPRILNIWSPHTHKQPMQNFIDKCKLKTKFSVEEAQHLDECVWEDKEWANMLWHQGDVRENYKFEATSLFSNIGWRGNCSGLAHSGL